MPRITPKAHLVPPVQAAYRRALSASVLEHARFLAEQGEKSVTAHKIERQKATWQMMEARRARLQARLLADQNLAKPD